MKKQQQIMEALKRKYYVERRIGKTVAKRLIAPYRLPRYGYEVCAPFGANIWLKRNGNSFIIRGQANLIDPEILSCGGRIIEAEA